MPAMRLPTGLMTQLKKLVDEHKPVINDEKSNGRCRASLWPGSGSDMLKGHFTRAKQLQADLYNRTATQYM